MGISLPGGGWNPNEMLDPLGISGTAAAESTVASAQANADLMRGFSDVSQANLQPFLDFIL